MSRITWDQIGDRTFELGISNGVVYPPYGNAVPWNGLTGVETSVNTTSESLYLDGSKYDHRVTVGDFKATIKAFTYPDVLMELEGIYKLSYGLYAHEQDPIPFGLCFKTLIGNDVESVDHGYKLHIIYNALITPSGRGYNTIGENPTPPEFQWSMETIPESLQDARPTSHISMSSTDLLPGVLQQIEDILYGTEETEPRLPSIAELRNIIDSYYIIEIEDNEDGTWTATGPDELVYMTSESSFKITGANAEYLNSYTYEIKTTNE